MHKDYTEHGLTKPKISEQIKDMKLKGISQIGDYSHCSYSENAMYAVDVENEVIIRWDCEENSQVQS